MRFMIYGANGYTGVLLAEEAVKRGHRPVLAGRSAEKVAALAQRLGLPFRAFDLRDPQRAAQALSDVDLVLHAAGPFVDTSAPMIEACLIRGAHYLDITGEVPVFEHTFAQHSRAVARGVVLMSGVGFDVVPTDCLAAYVASKVKDASHLELAIAAGDASAGTTKSSLRMMLSGGFVRRDGKLVPHPFGKGVRNVRFANRTRAAMPIPWGDLSTAYRTTGIPNITTYMAFPSKLAKVAGNTWRLQRLAMPLVSRVLQADPIKERIERAIEQRVQGPSEAARNTKRAYVWARAANARGESKEAWLETSEAYALTAASGVRIAERVLSGKLSGALTPAGAFGPDFVLELPACRRFDRLPEAGGTASHATAAV